MNNLENADIRKLVPTGSEALSVTPKSNLLVLRGLVELVNDVRLPKEIDARTLDLKKALHFYNLGKELCYDDDEQAIENFDKAISEFSKIARLDPNNTFVLHYRGKSLMEKAMASDSNDDLNESILNDIYALAIADFSEVIRIDSTDVAAYLLRAQTWSKIGDHYSSMDDYCKAIKIDPNNAIAYQTRGTYLYHRHGCRDKAIRDFDEAIRLDPNNAQWYRKRADRRRSNREWDLAIEDFNNVIRIDSENSYAFWKRGDAWYHKADYDRSISDYDEAIRLSPDFYSPYAGRGMAWLKNMDYVRAMADFDQVICLYPTYVQLEWVAWMLSTHPDCNFRNGVRAIQLATKAADETGWKNSSVLETLAAAYAEIGDFDKAVALQTSALEALRHPNRDWILRRLELYKQNKPYRVYDRDSQQ